MSLPDPYHDARVTLKLNEQPRNVYENKGPRWKTSRKSGNVIENTYTYPQITGMSLKTKLVTREGKVRLRKEGSREIEQNAKPRLSRRVHACAGSGVICTIPSPQPRRHSRESGNPLCEPPGICCLQTGFPLSRE
jgi:hypothetical protein